MTTPKVILLTFAGRRDRMELLTEYASRAIERGLIDEWHVWEFARNPQDSRWLRDLFPVTQVTPSNSTEYFPLPQRLAFDGTSATFTFDVRALNDVHLALRRVSGDGSSYEVVLGGWANQGSAVRKFNDPEMIIDLPKRDPQHMPVAVQRTPGLLPEFGFAAVEVSLSTAGLSVGVNGATALQIEDEIGAGEFELFYRTGYGSNGDWRFDCFKDHPARLFVSGPEAHFPPNALFYTRAYQHYVVNREQHVDDVFLKCDDDIVYFDLDRLADFISFRKRNREYFLVSANVINNGVCAYFQQQAGALPRERIECELPPGGLCGSIWSDGAKAELVHQIFLQNPAPFHVAHAPIIWNERISINFVAFLGADLIHIPDLTQDDEHDLCYGVRKRAKKQNCIFPGFVAAHLSFWKQDSEMDVADVIRRYRTLAYSTLGQMAA